MGTSPGVAVAVLVYRHLMEDLEMLKTPSALKWLAEKRGRLAHDLGQTRQIAADVNAGVCLPWRPTWLPRFVEEGLVERQHDAADLGVETGRWRWRWLLTKRSPSTLAGMRELGSG